ncbi:MAG: D-alanyl-D-alanine carboxypeptidase/D-alanyl-D-alanine-endopeptidase [Bacteroidota bacterium]
MHYQILFTLLLSCWLSTTAHAQSTLQRTINQWAASAFSDHASLGVCVTDASTGEYLAGFQPNLSLIPASNLKAVTTATALGVLGGDYRFTTVLAYDGKLSEDGVLDGNLYLIGSGDPTLGSPEMEGVLGLPALLERWRLAVQRAGIRRVTGRVIGDDLVFTSAATGSHYQWLDMGNYYGCGAFGLNIHENLYYLHFQQTSRLGATPRVAEVTPTIPGLQFTNEVTSDKKGTGDNAYIYGTPYTYQRFLRGTIPVGNDRFIIKGAIPDPPLFAAQQLTQALESVGILCSRPPASLRHLAVAERSVAQRTSLDEYASPPLRAIVDRTNQKSVNLYAEILLRAIGQARAEEGSLAGGLNAQADYWTGLGLDLGGVHLFDGSGMSPRNVLPTRVICNLLSLAYRQERIREDLLNSLPLAGRTGSLRNYFKGTAAEGRLRAKSGYIEGVRAYSGYVPDRTGRTLAFSLIVNNYDGSAGDARRQLFQLMQQFPQIDAREGAK